MYKVLLLAHSTDMYKVLLLAHSTDMYKVLLLAQSTNVYKVLLLAHSTLMGHATSTGPRPVPWNQMKSGKEMDI